jgi:hypothetical protein
MGFNEIVRKEKYLGGNIFEFFSPFFRICYVDTGMCPKSTVFSGFCRHCQVFILIKLTQSARGLVSPSSYSIIPQKETLSCSELCCFVFVVSVLLMTVLITFFRIAKRRLAQVTCYNGGLLLGKEETQADP